MHLRLQGCRVVKHRSGTVVFDPGKKWFKKLAKTGLKLMSGVHGGHKGPPAGVRGCCPLKLLTLQQFRTIPKLLLAAVVVNLERKTVML